MIKEDNTAKTLGVGSSATWQMIELAIRNDSTIGQEKQDRILGIIANAMTGDESESLRRVVSRSELCQLTNRTPQWLDWMGRKHPGALVKVQAPGVSRAQGYTYESVQAYLDGKCGKEVV